MGGQCCATANSEDKIKTLDRPKKRPNKLADRKIENITNVYQGETFEEP